jgi:hypothetical protein
VRDMEFDSIPAGAIYLEEVAEWVTLSLPRARLDARILSINEIRCGYIDAI